MNVKHAISAISAVFGLMLMPASSFAEDITFDFRPNDITNARGAYQMLATKEAGKMGILRTHRIKVDAPNMNLEVADGDMLTFRLFNDREFRVLIVEKLPSVTETESWLGITDGYGETFNSVVVRTADGWQLDVQDFQNGLSYRVYTANDVATISECDTTVLRPCCGTSTAEARRIIATYGRNAALSLSDAGGHRAAADASATYVDVLLCFDKSAQSWCTKNSTTVASFAATAVAKMNTAIANTGLDTRFRFRLAGTYNVNGNGGNSFDRSHRRGLGRR